MKNFKNRLYRAYNNVFGKMGGMFLCGGLLCVCCNALPAGITMLAASGVSLLFCAGKLALEDHEVEQLNKYFPEPSAEEYKSETKVATQELSFENEANSKTNQTDLTK